MQKQSLGGWGWVDLDFDTLEAAAHLPAHLPLDWSLYVGFKLLLLLRLLRHGFRLHLWQQEVLLRATADKVQSTFP